ncbi:hypothetical protein D3C78_1734070 [compost metagenome]
MPPHPRLQGKAGQKIALTDELDADPQSLLRALLADGIEITIKDIKGYAPRYA